MFLCNAHSVVETMPSLPIRSLGKDCGRHNAAISFLQNPKTRQGGDRFPSGNTKTSLCSNLGQGLLGDLSVCVGHAVKGPGPWNPPGCSWLLRDSTGDSVGAGLGPEHSALQRSVCRKHVIMLRVPSLWQSREKNCDPETEMQEEDV